MPKVQFIVSWKIMQCDIGNSIDCHILDLLTDLF